MILKVAFSAVLKIVATAVATPRAMRHLGRLLSARRRSVGGWRLPSPPAPGAYRWLVGAAFAGSSDATDRDHDLEITRDYK